MRFLSAFLIVCFLFLSFAGAAKLAVNPTKKDCCQRSAGMKDKAGCSNKSSKQSKGCDKQGCPMMLSCTVCGFFGLQPLQLRPVAAIYIENPVHLYIIGNLSAYNSSDWKPPKKTVN